MIFTFYRAMGLQVGSSMVEEDFIPLAKTLLEKARAKGVQFYLPEDVVVAEEFKADANTQIVDVKAMPAGWMGLDIGPKSIASFRQQLSDCKTVVWNGPMGVFEFDKFAAGTTAVAQTLADLTSGGAVTIIGGGDSVAAVHKAGLQSKMSHISTGGGASLEMLEGKVLPGVAALDEA
jgi:phosphoglycerate kinase